MPTYSDLTGRTRTGTMIIDFSVPVAPVVPFGSLTLPGGTTMFGCTSAPNEMGFPPVPVAMPHTGVLIRASAGATTVLIDIYVADSFGAIQHYVAFVPNASYSPNGTLTISGLFEQYITAGTDPATLRTYLKVGEYSQQGLTVTVDWNGTHTFTLAPLPFLTADWSYNPGGWLSIETPGSSVEQYHGSDDPPPAAPNYLGIPFACPVSVHAYMHPSAPYAIGVALAETFNDTVTGADGLLYNLGTVTHDFANGLDLIYHSNAVYYPYESGVSGTTGLPIFHYKWTGPRKIIRHFAQMKKTFDVKGRWANFDVVTGLNPRALLYGAVANPSSISPTIALDGDLPTYTITQTWNTSLNYSIPLLNTVYDTPRVEADTATILARSGDSFVSINSGADNSAMYPLRAFNWNCWTITHAATTNLPAGTWSATGAYAVTAGGLITPSLTAGTAVFTIPRFIMEGYRYLKIPVVCIDVTGQTLQITINGKVWTKSITTATTFIEVDLCAPDGVADTLLGQDSRWPLVLDTGHWRARDETGHWGINQTTAITISSISTVTPLQINAMNLFRKGTPIIECINEYRTTHEFTETLAGVPTSSNSRKMVAIVDGRLSLEWPSNYDIPVGGVSSGYNIVDYANGIPGWSASLGADGPFFASSGGDPLWSSLAGFERAMLGGFWNAAGAAFVDSSKINAASYTGVCQLAFNELRTHPGCGDPMTGTNYGSMSASTPMRFMMFIRGKAWGVAFAAGVPASGLAIAVTQSDTGAAAGSATTDAGGYWESGTPFGRHGKNHKANAGPNFIMIGNRRNRAVPKNPTGFAHLTRTSHDGLLYAVYPGTTNLQLNRFDLSGRDETFDVPIGVVTSAQIAAGRQGELLIAYESASTIYAIRSTNAGVDWGAPVAIGAGTAPAPAIDTDAGTSTEFVAANNGTDWVCWRLDAAAGTWAVVGTIVHLGSDYGRGLEVNSSADKELVFVLNDSGSLRKFVSTNFGVDWVEI